MLDTFTVITLPGAAPGEIALHAEGVLHVGDALIHLPSTGFALRATGSHARQASAPHQWAVRRSQVPPAGVPSSTDLE
ncbi:MAG: hypothetical protein EB140_03485 [Proteobacteria bacterium]|nr:hypothetical protein [Pseudomonadota bacterium]